MTEPKLTPSELSLRGQIGAHESWARTPDRSARTAPGRRAFDQKFYDDTDPNLPEAVRLEQATSARKAYFTRMAFQSVRARQRKASGR